MIETATPTLSDVSCHLCPGTWGGPVFHEGNPAPICWVGEALGEQEVKQKRPLIGPAGQCFTQMLTEAGLKREDQWLMNVCSCRPPNNQIQDAMIQNCRPTMVGLIEECKPQVIVALGTTAARALAAGFTGGITNKRGSVSTYTMQDGRKVPVVITLHPSFIMRTEGFVAKEQGSARVAKLYRTLTVGDFRLAAKLAQEVGTNG